MTREEGEAKIIRIDEYRPDYNRKCEVCGASQVVTGWADGTMTYRGDQCGPCTWGEARTLDPATWNEETP